MTDDVNGERRQESMADIIDRCSDLEGFAWLLWRKGVVVIDGENVLVTGVDVPPQFAAAVIAAVEEFERSKGEYLLEQARRRGVLSGGTAP